MTQDNPHLGRLLQMIVGHLDIPKSLYEKAAARHVNLGEWLQRPESKVAEFDPDVRPQGSFRFGTVIRPLHKDDEYDLDNVCVLNKLGKEDRTQKELKELFGGEVKAYAKAHKMLKPVTEHKRCWRLQYSDEVNFHLDSLPCVPEEGDVVQRLVSLGVDPELAGRAVAITDKRDPNYEMVTSAWPSSNPRGFAKWFEERAALGRSRSLSGREVRAMVEEVPPYEWQTTLQQTIQLMKRHRDVLFSDPKVADFAPISMIITNLAARAYGGEADLRVALGRIVETMTGFIQAERPRVPNPADPEEDYADKWRLEPKLEESFGEWHEALKADLGALSDAIDEGKAGEVAKRLFAVELTEDELREIEKGKRGGGGPAIITSGLLKETGPAAEPKRAVSKDGGGRYA
jgi:hypothetical protein